MPASKRRKVMPTVSKNKPSSAATILSFTKVSKSRLISKSLYEKAVVSATAQVFPEPASERKRKLPVVDEIGVDRDADQAAYILLNSVNQSKRDVKSLPPRYFKDLQRLPETPKKPILVQPTSSSADTPTKGAKALLDEFALSSSSPRNKSTSPSRNLKLVTTHEGSLSHGLEIDTQIQKNADEKLPTELLDLIDLHASFLTALSLHQAHNGAHSPADLRMLCPDVVRAWGKRKVMLDDIRRILGILNSGNSVETATSKPVGRLSLSDYGYGKVCVEIKSGTGKRAKIARPLDENRLNDMFTSNLQSLWDDHRKVDGKSLADFIQNLPMETISICSSLSKMSPLLVKGQRRLEDMRTSAILKKVNEMKKDVPLVEQNGRKPTLLERLKAKELLQSTLPAPPSKAELSRHAALHRLEEVVAVLTLLTTSTSIGQQRVSFTLPTVLGKLRDSFKTPMSKEEGECCVRLLAVDIAPEWLRIVKMGKVDAIVVNRDNRPSDLDLLERVRRAG